MSAIKLASLEKEFFSKALERSGSLFLLQANDALEFLGRGQEEGLVLLGFDSFRLLNDNGIQPILEYSPDYSLPGQPQMNNAQRYNHARSLISQLARQELYFEFVFDMQS